MQTQVVRTMYNKLIEATAKEQALGISLAVSKKNLEVLTLTAIAEGKIEGKNAQARDASAYEMFKDEHENVILLEQQYTEAQNQRRLAQLEVDCIRDIIRVEELSTAR